MNKFKLFGGIGLAAIGAGAGASIGSIVDENAAEGAATGTVIGGLLGAASIPGGALLGKAALGAADATGSAIFNIAKSTAGVSGAEAGVAGTIGAGIGAMGKGLAKGAGAMVAGFGTESTGAMLASPIQRHLTAMKGFTEKIVKYDEAAEGLSKVKFTGLGKTIIAGAGVIQGISGAKDELMKQHMGQIDPMMHTATPRTPAYNLNAGATGDLVFALNANRRG